MSLTEDKLNQVRRYALKLFQAYGFSRVSMDEIARGTGIGKGTLYKYFHSKEELMINALEAFLNETQEDLDNVIRQDLPLAEKIRLFFALSSQKLSTINREAMLDLGKNLPRAWELIDTCRRKILYTKLAGLLEEGKRSGYLREDLNVNLTIHIMVGAISHFTAPEVLKTLGPLTLDQLLGQLLSLLFKGALKDPTEILPFI